MARIFGFKEALSLPANEGAKMTNYPKNADGSDKAWLKLTKAEKLAVANALIANGTYKRVTAESVIAGMNSLERKLAYRKA